jgi:hypothetical protein
MRKKFEAEKKKMSDFVFSESSQCRAPDVVFCCENDIGVASVEKHPVKPGYTAVC